jgi:hypothetical protein
MRVRDLKSLYKLTLVLTVQIVSMFLVSLLVMLPFQRQQLLQRVSNREKCRQFVTLIQSPCLPSSQNWCVPPLTHGDLTNANLSQASRPIPQIKTSPLAAFILDSTRLYLFM